MSPYRGPNLAAVFEARALEVPVRRARRQAMDAFADAVVDEVKDRTPVGETGELRRSWKVTASFVRRGAEVRRVGTNVWYAHMVENGVHPHTIDLHHRPGRHGMPTGGGTYRAKVDHPGITGHHMLLVGVEVGRRHFRTSAAPAVAAMVDAWRGHVVAVGRIHR